MAMSKNLKKQWRVQVRKSRAHKWVNKGLYETRGSAREQAAYLREGRMRNGKRMLETAFGFGNTRVVPYVKGGAK